MDIPFIFSNFASSKPIFYKTMIQVFRKSDGKEVPLSEFQAFITEKLRNRDTSEKISDRFITKIDGKEVDPESVRLV